MNEVAKTTSVLSAKSTSIELPDFSNKEKLVLAEEPRRLKINVAKKKTRDGKLFNSITGFVKLNVYDGIEGIDEEIKFIGTMVKQISVHFKRGAFKDSLNVTSPEDGGMKSGYLYVKAKGLRIPNSYRIKVKTDPQTKEPMYDEAGDPMLKYPEIWIESDIIGLQAFVTSQDALDVDDESNVVDANVDAETGEVLDESSNNETEEFAVNE